MYARTCMMDRQDSNATSVWRTIPLLAREDADGEASEAPEKAWDEGLTPWERTEALRKFKNKKASRRWRAKKVEVRKLLRTGAFSSDNLIRDSGSISGAEQQHSLEVLQHPSGVQVPGRANHFLGDQPFLQTGFSWPPSAPYNVPAMQSWRSPFGPVMRPTLSNNTTPTTAPTVHDRSHERLAPHPMMADTASGGSTPSLFAQNQTPLHNSQQYNVLANQSDLGQGGERGMQSNDMAAFEEMLSNLRTREGSSSSDSQQRQNRESDSRMQNGIYSLLKQLEDRERQAENMLYESNILSQPKARKLNRYLHQISGYAYLPGGFQKHKSQILSLCAEVMEEVGRAPALVQDTATKFLGMIDQHESWDQVGVSSFREILQAFANGRTEELFLELPDALFSGPSRISVSHLSQLNQDVCARMHVTLVQAIQKWLPVVSGPDHSAALESQRAITKLQATLVAINLSWIVGQPASLSAMRAISKAPANLHAGEIQHVLSLVSTKLFGDLQQNWAQFQATERSLLERTQNAERHFDVCLTKFEQEKDGRLLNIVNAVQELMTCYNDSSEHLFRLEVRSASQMTPVQLGILTALYLPEVPFDQLMEHNWNLFFSFSSYFAAGVLSTHKRTGDGV